LSSELERLFGAAAATAQDWWPNVPQFEHASPKRSAIFSAVPSPEAAAALGGEAKLWAGGSFADELVCSGDEALVRLGRDRATAKIEGVDRLVPAIADALESVRDELATPIRRTWANLYISAPGVGVAEHDDGHEVIAVQISGAKEWRFWHEGERATVTLRPGSVLFMPRGIRHATEAIDLSVSLSLSFACYTLADLALHAVERFVRSRPAWDRAVSIEGPSHLKYGDELDGVLRTLGAEFASGGVLAVRPDEGLP
jgi:hypothetical protein